MDTTAEIRRARYAALAPSESRFERSVRRLLPTVDADAVIDELGECEDVLNVALAKGDAALIGRIVLAARKSIAERWANREDFDGKLVLKGTRHAALKVMA